MQSFPSKIALLTLILASLAVTASRAAAAEEAVFAEVTGQVVDEQGKPVPGVAIRSIAYDAVTETKTDDDGKFTVRVDEKRLRQLAIFATDATGKRMGLFNANYKDLPENISISLEACRELPVEVSDSEGGPCGEAIVGVLIDSHPVVSAVTDPEGRATLRWPASHTPNLLYTCKPQVGFDYRVISTHRDKAHQAKWLDQPPVQLQLAPSQTVAIHLVDRQGQPIPDVGVAPWTFHKQGEPDNFNFAFAPWFYKERTNQAGIATFSGIPEWDVHPLTFWPTGEGLVHDRIIYDPKQHPNGQMTVTIDRLVPVSGVVQDTQGNPVDGVKILAEGANYSLDRKHENATTDKQGKFTFQLAPNYLYAFAVDDKQWGAPLLEGIVIRPDQPRDDLKMTVRPATRIFGRVTIGPEGEPVVKQRVSLRFETKDAADFPETPLPKPEDRSYGGRPFISRSATTDEDGTFEFFVGPGKYAIEASYQLEMEHFEVFAQPQLQFNFHVPRKEKGPVSGIVVTGEPAQPVVEAAVEGKYRAMLGQYDARFRTDAQGQFSGDRLLHRTVWYAKSKDGKLAGIVETGPDEKTVTIPIAPVASVTGRFVDRETKAPIAGLKIRWGRDVNRGDDLFETAWGGSDTTDEDGRFSATGLVVGQEYSFSFATGKTSSRSLPPFTPLEPGEHDLGDVSEPERR